MTELLNCATSLRLFSAYKHIRDPKQAAEHLESELTTPKQNIGGANRLSQTHGLHILAPEMGTANYGKNPVSQIPHSCMNTPLMTPITANPMVTCASGFQFPGCCWASNVDRQLLELFSKGPSA